MLLSSYSETVVRFILDQDLKQWLTGRKRGKDRNIKSWIPWEQKELLRWNKKTAFIVFEGLSFGEKYKFVKK